MYIRTLKIHNYRMFEDLELNFNEHYSVIVGTNGAGKTTVLEAAAVAAGTVFQSLNGAAKYGFKKNDAHRKYFPMGENVDVQQQYPVEVWAEGVVDGKEISWKRTLNSRSGSTTITGAKEMTDVSSQYQKRLQEGDTQLCLPILAYYGTGRLWDYHREKRGKTLANNTRINGYIDCLDGTANIKLMMNWFQKMVLQKYQRQEIGLDAGYELNVVYRAMEKCFTSFTGCSDAKIQYNLDTNELDVYYTNNDNLRVHIPLSLLSDGYKSTISLIADIAYRMAVLNPQLSENVLTHTEGIVLIDEVDLHLHPGWQQKVMKDLTSIFPNVQFIVTTHSPTIISSVAQEHLVILRNGETDSAPSQTYGKDINSILKEIMGAKDRVSEVDERFKSFYDCLYNKKFDDAEKILNEIDEMRSYHDPEAAGCRVKLKLERIRNSGII